MRRLVSRYRYLVDSELPQTIAVSNVEQHSWLGYDIFRPPNLAWSKIQVRGEMEPASGLKVSHCRFRGIHEDIYFTNFTQDRAQFVFEIELDSDYADRAEIFGRKQRSDYAVIGDEFSRAGRS